jgi:hypothetical protein
MVGVYPGMGRLMRSKMDPAAAGLSTLRSRGSDLAGGSTLGVGGSGARAVDVLAETAGFEPARECYPPNRLAGGCFRPLSHVSGNDSTEGFNR